MLSFISSRFIWLSVSTLFCAMSLSLSQLQLHARLAFNLEVAFSSQSMSKRTFVGCGNLSRSTSLLKRFVACCFGFWYSDCSGTTMEIGLLASAIVKGESGTRLFLLDATFSGSGNQIDFQPSRETSNSRH